MMLNLGSHSGFLCWGGVVLSAIGLAGCGAEAPDSSVEAVGSTSQALACPVTTYLTSGGSPVFGPSPSTHFCALSQVDGRDGILRSDVTVDIWGSNWVVVGDGGMNCVPRSCFTHPDPNFVTMLQSTFWVRADNQHCNYENTNMNWTDAASVVQGISNWNSPRGSVNTLIQATLEASTMCDPSAHVDAWGNTFYVGVPSTGDTTAVSQIQTVGSSWPNTATLIQVSKGFCFYKNVGRNLAGSTNYTRIYPSPNGYWLLKTTGSIATAQCMYYAQ